MRDNAPGRHARRRPPSLRHYLLALLAAVAALVTALAFAAAPSKAVTAVPAAHQGRAVTAAPGQDRVNKADLIRAVTAARAAAARHAASVLAAHTYLVRGGDSISGVAVRKCAAARDWTGIYAASRARGWTGRDANQITTGQKLYLLCAYDAAQLKFAAAPAAPVHATAAAPVTSTTRHDRFDGQHGRCGDGDGDGMDASCAVIFPQSHAAASASTDGDSGSARNGTYSAPSASGTYHGSGSMQACIIARESGGNSQIWNASGHYGLYQFSASTWAAHGGNPADFGHASVAEQNTVYYATVAADGYSDWAPYDGC